MSKKGWTIGKTRSLLYKSGKALVFPVPCLTHCKTDFFMSFNMTGNLNMATTLEGPSPFNDLRQLVLKCTFYNLLS